MKKAYLQKCLSALLAVVLLLAVPGLPMARAAGLEDYAPEGTVNVALEAAVTATDEYPYPQWGWSKDFLTDGQVAASGRSGWTTTPNQDEAAVTTPVTVTLDLDGVCAVRRIVLFPSTDRGDDGSQVYAVNFPVQYQLQGLDAAGVWQDLTAVQTTTARPESPVVFDLTETAVTQVRLVVTERVSRSDHMVQLDEIAVYGTRDSGTATGGKYDVDSWAPEGTRNVALNKTPDASSTYESPEQIWLLSNLVDGVVQGDPAYYWGTNGWSTSPFTDTNPDDPAWVSVDLGGAYTISRIVLFPVSATNAYGANFPEDYKLQISDDGKNWTDLESTVTTGQPTPTKPVCFDLEGAPSARYVKLDISKRSGIYAQLSELAVFGVPGALQVRMSKRAVELLPGQSETIDAALVDSASELNPVWTSDDTAVAVVDQTGAITGVAPGKTVVHMKDEALGIKETVTVYVVDKKFDFEDNILISVFWPPTLEYMGDDDAKWEEQYQLLEDAGIDYINNVVGGDLNAVETNKKMAAYAYKHGMRLGVADSRFGAALLNETAEEIAAAVEEYRNLPGVAGYYILDEPANANPFLDVYTALKQADPSGYAHLNFLPAWAYGADNQTTYESVLNDWLCLNAAAGYPQDYLMYDLYPYGITPGSMNRTGYLSNLRSVWKVGLANDVKTANYLQSVCVIGAYRQPTVSEIRYEAMMDLAFGVKQMSYFTWFTPSNRPGEEFENAVILLDGTPNPNTYAGICQLNSEIHTLGQYLVKMNAREIYLNGETWGQPSVPADFFAQPVDDTNYTVSFLRDKETGRNYLMVVNNNYESAATVTLRLDDAITGLERVSARDGSFTQVQLGDGNTLSVTLAAGDGALFALPEDLDYLRQRTVTPGENLALQAHIVADSSVGEEGKFIDRMNDGVRDTSTGWWQSKGKAEAVLTMDLGLCTEFNRVDLYPLNGLFGAGADMPSALRILASSDGTEWKQVYETDNLTLAGDAAPMLRFDTVSARYLRLEITKSSGEVSALAEIEVYLDDGTIPDAQIPALETDVVEYHSGDNIALQKPYQVSSATPDQTHAQWGWSARYLNDGIYGLGNGWTSNIKIHFDQETAHEWATVFFGDTFAVDRVRFYSLPSFYTPIDYRIQLSMDGRNWTDIAVVTGDDGSEGWREFTPETPVEARYVRIYGDTLRLAGADGYIMQLSEIEAYGTPVKDTAAAEALLRQIEAESPDWTCDALDALEAAVSDPDVTQSKLDALLEAALEACQAARQTVTVLETLNGRATVTASRETALPGSTVTVSVTDVEPGKLLSKLRILAGDTEVPFTVDEDGVYTFTMPDAGVTVQAVLEKEAVWNPVRPVTPGTSSKPEEEKLPFTDVGVNDWFYDNVRYVQENGLMNGVSATAFAPDRHTTRAMVVTILYRMEQEPQAGKTAGFADVLPGAYYEQAVAWAAERGIVTGYGNGCFGPDDVITREQLAAILFRHSSFKGWDVTARADLSVYADYPSVSGYAVEAMQWCAAAQILNGKSASILAPKDLATRAELAAMIQRLMEMEKEI